MKSRRDDIIGTPQQVKLPFPCERQIHSWEFNSFANLDTDFLECLGDDQTSHFHILTVELIGIERIKKDFVNGRVRMLGDPDAHIPEPDDSEEEDEMENWLDLYEPKSLFENAFALHSTYDKESDYIGSWRQQLIVDVNA